MENQNIENEVYIIYLQSRFIGIQSYHIACPILA